jgi:TM2 domain-containing membrane protein YozV
MPATAEQPQQHEPVDLKDPLLAAFLAWLVPGLGHLYQGRTAKAVLFFVCISGTFAYGLYLGSSNDVLPGNRKVGWARVYYFASPEPGNGIRQKVFTLARWACEVGIGLPTVPALIQYRLMRDQKEVRWGGFMAPPWTPSGNAHDPNRNQPTESDLQKHLHYYFQVGVAYTVIAGLLNVLAIYDAWGGPVFSETPKKEDQEDQPDDTPAES